MNNKNSNRGFTLIELMVTITLGLVILAGVVQVFVSSKQGYQVQRSAGRYQESTRFAMEYLNTYIRQADFWGGAKPSAVSFAGGTSPSSGTGCANAAWIVDPTNGIHGYQGAASLSALTDATLSACLTSLTPGYVPNSDILVIRYVNADSYVSTECASAPGATTDCPKGSPVTATSGYWSRSMVDLQALLYNSSTLASVNTALPNNYANYGAAIQNYQFQALIFYLAVSDNGEGLTPTLYMLPVQGTSMGPAQPLVDGVEMLKFDYGVDPSMGTSVQNYSVDQYTSATNVSNWSQVLSVRVSMIVRGDTLDNFTDTQTYQMTDSFCYGPSGSGCGATYSGTGAVADTSASYQRRLVVKDIFLRNRVRQ